VPRCPVDLLIPAHKSPFEGVASRSRTVRIVLVSTISIAVGWGLGPLCFALCLAVCGPGAVNCPTGNQHASTGNRSAWRCRSMTQCSRSEGQFRCEMRPVGLLCDSLGGGNGHILRRSFGELKEPLKKQLIPCLNWPRHAEVETITGRVFPRERHRGCV
jgi:hypothetical protein